jgi:CRISPR/Cas system-associated protein endoribonuclease Cas2
MDDNIKQTLINGGWSIREYNIIKKILRGEQITQSQRDEVQYILNEL